MMGIVADSGGGTDVARVQVEKQRRHAFNNRLLRATLVHAVAIFPFAAAYWGLLPLISRRADATPGFYGILLSALSVGTIIGSVMQGRLREHLDDDAFVVLGSVATAAALAMYALFPTHVATVGASLVAGAGWVLILIGHYSSAEHALPDWVRARGLAVFLTLVFGSVTVGAYGWGYVAGWLGLDRALLLSAAGALLAIPSVWTWKLARSESVDLTPSLHWRVPQSAQPVENSRGPFSSSSSTALTPPTGKSSCARSTRWEWSASATALSLGESSRMRARRGASKRRI